MQQCNFVGVFLALHTPIIRSTGRWVAAPSLRMGVGLESRCVTRVCGADGAVHGTIRMGVCT